MFSNLHLPPTFKRPPPHRALPSQLQHCSRTTAFLRFYSLYRAHSNRSPPYNNYSAYRVLTDYDIPEEPLEEREALRWKVKTRRRDATAEEFALNHRHVLGDKL